MEVSHYCLDSPIDQPQDQLRRAARESMITTLGWPIGLVLDRDDARPRPKNNGIFAEIRSAGFTEGVIYDYWELTRNGDFYTLMSLFEDDRDKMAIFVQSRILRTIEALLHCAKLYRSLGADSAASIDFTIWYHGLRDRSLKSSAIIVELLAQTKTSYEDELTTTIVFRLDRLESDLSILVEDLCSPLFLLFDFFKLPSSYYVQLISEFKAGRIY
jgi:hypothetical protein